MLIHRPSIGLGVEKEKFVQLVSGCRPMHERDDQLTWLFNSSGQFSVNSYYKFLNCRGMQVVWASIIWKSIAPLKVKVFLWLLLRDRLQTKDQLTKKRCTRDLPYLWERIGDQRSYIPEV